jgi:hypothetical protein
MLMGLVRQSGSDARHVRVLALASSTRHMRDRAMRVALLAISSALLTSVLLDRAAAATAVPRINCEFPHQRKLNLEPLGTGPLKLTAVYCLSVRFHRHIESERLVSPDGQSIAYLDGERILWVARLDGGKAWTEYRTDMGVFARFGSNIRSLPAIAWAANSRFLWAASQDKVRPSGFATSPLRPLRTAENGSVEPLAELRHETGPLDALLWAGHAGLAVAQFGTRGGFYRPPHDDPSPTFAIVDAARGNVLDTLPFASVEWLRKYLSRDASAVLVRNAAATALPDGRVRALLSVGEWVVWTQGEPARAMPDPYAAEYHNRLVLSPDGRHVLVGRLLRTQGGICGGRTGGCRPGSPVEGVLAALHDLDRGQPLWTIRARVTNDHEFPTPAISPDGRHALVGLVPTHAGPRIALVTMDRGEIVQTLPTPGGTYSMGFTHEGRSVWTHAHGLTALYDIRDPVN